MDKISHALEWAARAHRGQVRKGSSVPYLVHPLNVAKILIHQGCEEDLVIAGLLHDTVEDTDVEQKDLELEFGSKVAALVAGVSEPDRTASWESRKEHTIHSMGEAPLDVLWIVCADKLDNLRSLREDLERVGSELWTYFSRPKSAQSWYYRSLLRELEKRFEGPLLEQLRLEVDAVFAESGD